MNSRLSATSERLYHGDQEQFAKWCRINHWITPIAAGPNEVIQYLNAMKTAGAALQSIERARASIRRLFIDAELEPPTMTLAVQSAMATIRFGLPKRKVHLAAVRPSDVQRMIKSCPNDLVGLRDRLILSLLHYEKMRRAELTSLTTSDIPKLGECAQTAAFKWIKAANISEGALIRAIRRNGKVQNGQTTPDTINRIVKSRANVIGLGTSSIASSSLYR